MMPNPKTAGPVSELQIHKVIGMLQDQESGGEHHPPKPGPGGPHTSDLLVKRGACGQTRGGEGPPRAPRPSVHGLSAPPELWPGVWMCVHN